MRIYVLCNVAIKNILLSWACAFKMVILQSSNSIEFTLPVAFQISSIYDALCGCEGMKIGNNSEDNAFPDFLLIYLHTG